MKFKFKLHVALICATISAAYHRLRGVGNVALGNLLATPPGKRGTKLADEAIGRRRLVKIGSDADHIALCDAADIPLGFTRDSSAAAAADLVAFEHLGLTDEGAEGVSSGAITAGHLVCPGADGVLRDVTLLAATTVYVCGQATSSCADGGTFTYIPYPPVQRVIA